MTSKSVERFEQGHECDTQRDRQTTDHAMEKCVGIGGIACAAKAIPPKDCCLPMYPRRCGLLVVFNSLSSLFSVVELPLCCCCCCWWWWWWSTVFGELAAFTGCPSSAAVCCSRCSPSSPANAPSYAPCKTNPKTWLKVNKFKGVWAYSSSWNLGAKEGNLSYGISPAIQHR